MDENLLIGVSAKPQSEEAEESKEGASESVPE